MNSRLLVPAAGAGAVVLVVLAVVAVAVEAWVAAASAAGALALGMVAVQLDTWRRSRSTRAQVRAELARQPAATRGPATPAAVPQTPRAAVGEDDLRGALTMMQAQQAARLDRMQTTLDLALADLVERRTDPSR